MEDPVKLGDGMELGVVGGQVVKGPNESAAVFRAGCDGEGGLVAVVGEEEFAGGGGTLPGAADDMTAEEGFGGLRVCLDRSRPLPSQNFGVDCGRGLSFGLTPTS
jgi:hypothetical protein